jgi:hypothetical protein
MKSSISVHFSCPENARGGYDKGKKQQAGAMMVLVYIIWGL